MDYLETFLGVLSAFIIKDIYDIFLQKRLRNYLIKYKKYVKGETEENLETLTKQYNTIKKKIKNKIEE